MKTKIAFSLLGTFMLLAGYFATITKSSVDQEGMVKVTIMYPSGDGNIFDMDYYKDKHMPMVADLLGKAMKSYAIDKGIAGRTPQEPVPYMAIGYLYFDKIEDYQTAFGPVAQKILSDIPNYTNVQPVLQISEIIK